MISCAPAPTPALPRPSLNLRFDPKQRNYTFVSGQRLGLLPYGGIFWRTGCGDPQTRGELLRFAWTRCSRKALQRKRALLKRRPLLERKAKVSRAFRPIDSVIRGPYDRAALLRQIAVPPGRCRKRSMKSLGDFFDHLQRRRCGLDDRLDRGSGQEKLGGKFIGLALEFSRPVAPVPDVGLGANELRQVVIGQQKVSDFMGEREILAASLADRLPDRNRSQRNLARSNQGAVKPISVHLANLESESRSDCPQIAMFERQFAREGASIGAAFLRPAHRPSFGRLRLLCFKSSSARSSRSFLSRSESSFLLR